MFTRTYVPRAYTYEADVHCPGCAESRFGPAAFGTDSEGNPVSPVFSWDMTEFEGPVVCGTCHGDID